MKGNYEQGRQFTYNVIMRHVRATIVEVETQLILHFLRVCVRSLRYLVWNAHPPSCYMWPGCVYHIFLYTTWLSAEAIDLGRPYWILHPVSCHTPEAVTTVSKCSWGWMQKASETCRVLLQLLINILPSCITLVLYIYYIFFRYLVWNAHPPSCYMWPGYVYHIFLLYLINGTIFE